ncbi:hypothetical protein JCM10213_004870 [Rhodosporidiobolus nylandii]
MSSGYTKEQLDERIASALKLRLDGNEKSKAGDYPGALMAYHNVLLQLKGLESAISSIYSVKPTSPVISAGEEKKEGQPETKADVVHNAILLTYINQAAIHIKLERWQRAADCAQSALKIDEKNPKATFRLAQAKVGLGEVNAGRKMLEDLQKTSPDTAITAALKQLAINASASDSKTRDAFRGFLNRGSKGTNGNNSTNNASSQQATVGGSSSSTVKAEGGVESQGPKIVELDE